MSGGTDGGLFGGVVSRPVAITMIFLSTVVFGIVSWFRLPLALMPDISFPTITVRTTFEGAAPQEVEQQVSRPIEEALATLDGLVALESRSKAGQSDVVLGFDWGTDMSAASQVIRESLQTTFLPDEADRPLILRYDPAAEPFLRMALSYDADATEVPPEVMLANLRELADREVRRALEGVDGVAAVRVRGGFEREIRVAVRQDWLAARRVTLDQVREAFQVSNVNLAGGSIYEGDIEYLVRTLNEYTTVDELRGLRVRRSDGVLVPLSDLAVVEEVTQERTTLSRLDGAEAVEIEVFKEAAANVVQVAGRVKALLDAPAASGGRGGPPEGPPERGRGGGAQAEGASLVASLPEGVTLRVLDDQSEFISLAIQNLLESAVQGGLLSVAVLYLFLRDFRSTFIIGVTIPISAVMGFAPLYLGGVSLNVMSLGGLALGLSMLVDNAVVVLENIQRHREEGLDRVASAVRGTSEVALAMLASTLTSIAVFAPIAYVEGMAGELFGDLALAVIGAQIAGLATGVLLVPMMAAIAVPEGVAGQRPYRPLGTWWGPAAYALRGWAGGVRAAPWRVVTLPWALLRLLLELGWGLGLWSANLGMILTGWVLWGLGRLASVFGRVPDGAAAGFQRGFDGFAAAYARAIEVLLRRPGLILAAAVLALGLSWAGLRAVGAELLPEVHQGRFLVDARLPVGTPLRQTADVVALAEQIVADHPEVETVYATIGTDGRADAAADEGEHTARLRVQLTPGGDLAAREEAVVRDLRGALAEVPRLAVRFDRPSLFAAGTPVQLVVFGDDFERLRSLGEEAAAKLAADPAFGDVATSLKPGNPEVQITYDREQLARLGLDTQTVATRVRDRVQGVTATEIHRGDQRLDLRVQLVEDERASVDDLRRVNINPSVVPPIPLEAVASFREAVGPSEIRRVDQQRAVVVSASLAGFDLGDAVERVQAVARGLPLRGEESWQLGGQARDLGDSLTQMQLALALAVFLVYVIMATTFENLTQPLVILVSVPLGMVGVVGGLIAFATPLSIVAGLGVVVLAGVVVNNAIVLVDAINQLRGEGMGRDEAVRTAAATRLRPILITTSTAVLGLLPLLLGVGAGAELQRPMAVAIVGGLSSSTLLTLVVIPAFYLVFTRGDAPAGAAGHDAVGEGA